ncbi:MAG: phosphate-selective porin OprO/OprP [Planctomycetota bacterium]|jgi:phosphate-selective porin OprO/OprP
MSTLTLLVGALALAGAPNTTSDDAVSIDDSAAVNTNFNIVLPVDVTVNVFGRVQMDGVWGSGSSPFDTLDQVGFRRARVGVQGKAGIFDYKAEYDFAGGDVDFADVYIEWNSSPLGSLKVGNFKEPVGLEELSSSRFTTFTERASSSNLAPARNVGAMFADNTETMAWQYGVFGSDTDSSGGGIVDGMYALTGRIAGAVVNEEECLVHLGASLSNRSQDMVRYSARPEVPFVDRPIDSGGIDNDGVLLYGVEAAWVGGPASVQAEYTAADISDANGGDDATFSGYYIETSYYLTGETRNYHQPSGSFKRPPVNEDFDGEGGMGAVQLALRYSMLDLDDLPSMGELGDLTLGVNWWLNNHTRLSANYVAADYDDGGSSEDADYLVVRFQVDF